MNSWHPTTQELLCSLDGELNPLQMRWVHRHLNHCWRCRAELQDIETTVHRFLAFQSEGRQNTPPAEWSGFEQRLSALDRSSQKEPRPELSAIDSRGFVGFFGRFIRRPALIPAQILLTASLVSALFFRLSSIPSASAAQVLKRACNREIQFLTAQPDAGIYQQIAVQWKGQTFTRELFRSNARRRKVSKWTDIKDFKSLSDSTPRMLLSCERLLTEENLTWDDAMSPERYLDWLTHVSVTHQDKLEEEGKLLTLTSVFSSAGLFSVQLRLRADDYHVVAQRFEFADHSELRLTETAFEIRPSDYELGGDLQSPQQVLKSRPAKVMTRPEPDLGGLEVHVRAVLHEEGADLGQQINVRRIGKRIEVSGLLDDADLKTRLLGRLDSTEGVSSQIQTVEEAAAAWTPPTIQSRPADPLIASPGVLAPPILAAELKAMISDEERRRFVSAVLALSEESIEHAFALHELAHRYNPLEESALKDAARQELLGLVEDHLRKIRKTQEALETQLSALHLPQQEEEPDTGSWQAGVERLLPGLKTQRTALICLLVGCSEESSLKNESEVSAKATARRVMTLSRIDNQ